MEYVRQYQNRINWENEPSIATPINETNLNKMDKALNYMDGKMLEVVNAIGNDKNVRNAMITSVTQPRTLNAALDDYSGADQLADGDILVVKSTVEGTPTTGWILNIALTGLASVSVNLYSYNSVMFDASIQAGYGLIIKLDMTNSKGYVIGIMNDNGYVRQGKKSGTTVGPYATIEGYQNTASGHSSRAGGQFNAAGYEAQEVIGKYNDNKSNTLFEVGNGTSASAKSNAFEVYNDSKSSWDNGTSKFKFTKNNGIYGYYDESGVFHNIDDTLVGVGKVTSVTSGVVDTDIDLGRAPKVGDRILVLFDSSVSTVSAIKTYNGSTAVQTPWESVPVLDFHLNGVCIIEFIVDPFSLDPTAICARLVRMFEGTVYTAGTGISLSNNKITNTLPHMGVSIDGQSLNSVSSGFLGGYTKAAKYLIITFDCDAVPYNGEYHLSLSESGSVAIMYDAVLVDPVTGGRYSRNVKKYTTLICEVTNSGSGSSSDPILVNVIGEITNDLADKVDAVLDAISEEKTATGNPITITDALALPAVSLSASITPEQDLHGQSAPYVGGASKNKLPTTISAIKAANPSGTWSGNIYYANTGTFEIVTDDGENVHGIKVNGTFTAQTNFFIGGSVGTGNYIANGCPSGGTDDTYYLAINANGSWFNRDYGSGKSISGAISNVAISVMGGVAFANKMFYPMVRLSTESDASFAPWENKCPISGHTSLTITDRGNNLIDESALIAASLDPSTGQPSPSSDVKITPMIAVESSSAYLFANQNGNTFRIFAYAADGTFVERTDTYTGDAVVTTGATWKFIRIQGANTAWISTDPIFSQRITATISLGQTVYGAEINWDTGVMTVTHGFATFNGGESENWVLGGESHKYFRYPDIDAKATAQQSDIGDILSNEFPPLAFTGVYGGNYGVAVNTNGKIYVFVSNDVNTVALFKTWLSSNNLQIRYELATPIPITFDPVTMQLLNGHNRLSSDGGGNINLTYKADRLAAIEAALAQLGA